MIEGTGLHPRPSSPKSLQQYFPQTPLCPSYGSTVYASKRGESLSELLARAELVSPTLPRLVCTWMREGDKYADLEDFESL